MKYSFKLRNPKIEEPTPIYFTVFFKDENKSLVYSTNEKIHPIDWDFENKTTKTNKLKYHSTKFCQNLRKDLNNISDFFIEIESMYSRIGEKLTSANLKTELDERLLRKINNKKDFFEVYDEFLAYKKNDKSDEGISESTLKRYEYFKNDLTKFQSYSNRKITFESINHSFYNDFLNFCITEKKQSANTLHRNIGLFKTFLHWSLKNKKTTNIEFIEFTKPKKQPTTEIALNINQVTEIFKFDLTNNKRLEKVRDVFLIGCLTGQRFSNFKNFSNKDIVGNSILVPDCKNKEKLLSIPLMKVTKEILEKYDYNLPIITNQKFNEYIKEVFELIDYKMNTKRIRRYGKEIEEKNIPFYKRISSHTARRSFITIMLNQGVPAKVIMSITGHTSLSVFITYYKPDDDFKIKSMENAFQNLI
ncbi:MAG: tyrosine-type recombinase/integrase [Empedobacter falsenii]